MRVIFETLIGVSQDTPRTASERYEFSRKSQYERMRSEALLERQ